MTAALRLQYHLHSRRRLYTTHPSSPFPEAVPPPPPLSHHPSHDSPSRDLGGVLPGHGLLVRKGTGRIGCVAVRRDREALSRIQTWTGCAAKDWLFGGPDRLHYRCSYVPAATISMRGRNKIWVSVVFLLGIFSITASIIKLAIFTIINAPLGTSPHDFRGSSKMTSATVRTHESAPVGVDDVNGVSGTIAWWTMTECSFGNITCNLPIISGYIFQRFFSARVKSISSQIVTIGRKSFRLNNKGQSPPSQQTLDETVSHLTRTVGTEDGPISPSTVEHIELSPLEIPTRPV
ncbi:hypothetical protein PG987_001769 [Apiospora arundinis]